MTLTSDPTSFILRGATLLTMDSSRGTLSTGDLEIRDGSIISVGSHIENASDSDVIDASGMIALPGFVDTHWHVWGALLRAVVGDGPEEGWFARKGLLAPLMEPSDVFHGVRLGLGEAVESGITTVHDWNHYVRSVDHAEANLEALAESGVRSRFSWGPPTAAPQLDLAQMDKALSNLGIRADEPMDMQDLQSLKQRWVTRGEGLLDVGVNLRGPSRSTIEVVRREWAEARDGGLPIAMHCAGTREEVERIQQVAVLAEEDLLGPDILLAHCLYLDPDECAALGEHEVPVSVAPLSELRLAMGTPIIKELRDAGVPVSLSLDTTAITGGADFFQLMRVAVGLENARMGNARALTPHQVLEMATIEGARSLGVGDVTGSLTPGKRADVTLIDRSSLRMSQLQDPEFAVVYGASPNDIDTVIVDGIFLKRSTQLVRHDQAQLIADADRSLSAVCQRANLPLGLKQSVT